MRFTLAQELKAAQDKGSAWIRVADDVLSDPASYRLAALALPYGDVTAGVDVFKGIAPTDNPLIPNWIQGRYPDAVTVWNFFRKSPKGQPEPNYIHSDEGMGDWTALLYLHPEPPDGDGTIFYDTEGRVNHVKAIFGRLVLFDSRIPHSRAIEANYGEGDNARLIQVLFGRCN